MAAALCKLGWRPGESDEDFYQLLSRLKSADPVARAGAADALSRIARVRAVGPLALALNDEYEEVRYFAVVSLGAIGDAHVVDALIRALKDKSERGRLGAAQALGLLGDERASAPLARAMENEYSYSQSSDKVMEAASEALKKIKTRNESG